jgi:hypothetical protein
VTTELRAAADAFAALRLPRWHERIEGLAKDLGVRLG